MQSPLSMRIVEVDSGDPQLQLVRIENDSLSATFLPSVGGRLLSLAVGGRELLWRNPAFFDERMHCVRPRTEWHVLDGTFASWSNVGGNKTWPAPQGWGGDGEWAGPPDAVLDAGIWSIETSQTASFSAVVMTSPDDVRTGLRVTREFRIPAVGSTMSQVTTFENTSDRAVTWSIWEVSQVLTSTMDGQCDRDAMIEVSSSDASIVDLGSYLGDLPSAWADGVVRFPVLPVVAKRGFPSATGRIVYRAPDAELRIDFPIVESARYPDGGSRAELWFQCPTAEPLAELTGLHPDAWLVELEALGPLVELAPGQLAQLRTEWLASAR